MKADSLLSEEHCKGNFRDKEIITLPVTIYDIICANAYYILYLIAARLFRSCRKRAWHNHKSLRIYDIFNK